MLVDGSEVILRLAVGARRDMIFGSFDCFFSLVCFDGLMAERSFRPV